MSKALRTVLLIEDSPEDRVLIRRLLKADPDYRYELREAANGAEGLRLWREQPPDCVLLDYQLPDTDGLALLKTMVAEYKSFICPVVMLTGLAAPELAVAALKGGVQDFIIKDRTPPEQLHHAINSAIEKVAAQLELAAQRQQLAESEAKFSAAFHKSSACMSIVSQAEVKYVDVNQTSCDLFGFKREDVLGHSPAEFNIYADPAQRLALRELLNRDGYVNNFEVKWKLKTGEVLTHLLNADRIMLNGQPCLFVVSNDITERKRAEETLRDSEERLRIATDAAEMYAWEVDVKTQTIKYADNHARVLGFALPAEMAAMQEIIHPDDRAKSLTTFENALADGKDMESEIRLINPSTGKIVWICTNGIVQTDGAGNPWRIFGVVQNISRRKEAEEKLLKNQLFTQSIVDTAPTVLYIFDLKTKTTVYLSEQAAQALGFSSDEVKDALANFLERNMHPEDARSVERHLQKIAETPNGNFLEIEYRMRHKSGEWRWFRSRDRVFKRDENGKAQEILGIASDITERKQARDELRESEARFRRVLAQSNAGIVETDAAGRMTLVNQRWCEMLGYSEAELLQMSVLEVTHSSSQQVTLDNVGKLAAGGPDFEVEKNYQRKDGSMMSSFSKVSALRGKDGEYQGLVAVIMDITARVQHEQNLAFLAEVSQDLVRLTDIDETMSTLCAKIGGHFKVARVVFAEIGEDETTSVIRHEWRQDGLPTLREAAELKNLLTSKLESAQRDGDISYIRDVAAELRDAALTLTALGIASLLGAPLVRDKKLHLYLGILHSEPREWRADEIELMRELTNRIRTRLERARVEANLRVSEERFRRLFESAKDGILILSPDTAQIIDANPYIAELLGFSHTELLGKELWEIGLFKDIEKSKAAVQELQEKKYIRYEDLPLETKSGRRAHVEFVSNVYVEGDETVIQCNIRDITERRIVEKRLRDEEERFRLLTENARDYAMVFTDNESRITHWNSGAERVLGWTEKEIIGQSIARIFTPEDRKNQIPEKEIAIAKEKGQARDERWHIRKDETRFYAFGDMIALRDEAENLRGFVKLFRDLTEKKQAENRLRESEERFRALFDSIDEGFCIVEMIFDADEKPLDYRFIQVNPAFSHLTGFPTSAIGQTARELVPDLEDFWIETYGKVALTGEAVRFENQSDPMNPWFEVFASRIGDELSRRVAIVFNNITDRKEIEMRREQLLQQEQRARETAEAATRAKDDFLAVVSHELRNPLSSILGYARLLRSMWSQSIDPAQFKKAVDVIERSGKAQLELINDLLDTARVINGKLRLEVGRLDLALLLNDAIEVMRPAADAKNITMTQACETGDGQIVGDSQRLQQVIMNLVSNAVKFTHPGGHIHISLRRAGPKVEIQVRDNGIGITAEFLPHIFERFTQSDASNSRRHGGLGLGLALVKQLVELHGGTILVESEGEDKGTTFTIQLPVQAVAPAPEETQWKLALTEADRQRLAGVSALVIDDEHDARELLKKLLEDYGAAVTVATSAAEGFTLLTDEKAEFSILISDIGMPEEDGYSLIRRVRDWEKSRQQRVPAVALTAFGRTEDRMASIMAGFQMHVPKPVETEELIAVINSLLGRYNQSSS